MIKWLNKLLGGTTKADTDTGAVEGGWQWEPAFLKERGLSLDSKLSEAPSILPQYSVNFNLSAEERSARSRKAAATRKAKKAMTAQLVHENLRRDLRDSLEQLG